MTTRRKILITSALIYANGPMHLGHIIEQIQADIFARFQRLRGNECYYVAGDDAHGTPIMLSAEKLAITPEELIEKIGALHHEDIKDFLIDIDNYYTTHSEENKQLSYYIYNKLVENGDIQTKDIQQAFDPIKEMFLPDRYVKGTCPRCHSENQYGDNCEVCGATYTPAELINPVSAISGVTPIEKQSTHYFFRLSHYTEMLREWTQSGTLQTEVANKLNEWLKSGLESWDISRDAPYFGFEIPGIKNKYLYVWLDAPIGYMASFKNLCDRRKDLNFDEFWKVDATTELYHFIGKDIINFHGLFWPAMLSSAGFRTPTAIFTHGFLTVDGKKMSKSRGTFINARTYLNHLDAEYLRYYMAAKLSNDIGDIDLNFADFLTRVNAELVGKIVNIASRCAGFINKQFAGHLADTLENPQLYATLIAAKDLIASLYENRDYAEAIRQIISLADRVNQYIDEKKPWALAKEDPHSSQVQAICTQGINLFRVLMIYLKPVLPHMAEKSESFLNTAPLTWNDLTSPLLSHTIHTFQPLMQRIQQSQIDAIIAESTNPEISPVSRHVTS